jgi:hypothetical protein
LVIDRPVEVKELAMERAEVEAWEAIETAARAAEEKAGGSRMI